MRGLTFWPEGTGRSASSGSVTVVGSFAAHGKPTGGQNILFGFDNLAAKNKAVKTTRHRFSCLGASVSCRSTFRRRPSERRGRRTAEVNLTVTDSQTGTPRAASSSGTDRSPARFATRLSRRRSACGTLHHSARTAKTKCVGVAERFCDGIPAYRQGDRWVTHCAEDSCHDGTLSGGSSSVFVNGKPLGRIGDDVSCGSVVASGSPDVFSGG